MGRQKQLIVPLEDSVVESLHFETEPIRGLEVRNFPTVGGCVYDRYDSEFLPALA